MTNNQVAEPITLTNVLENVEQPKLDVAGNLSKLLANTYCLYLKTQNYHWNVRGPMFITLHQLFEEQYTELAEAVDDIAERIRALGYDAPGSLSEYAELSDIEDETSVPSAEAMIEQLAKDHAIVAFTAKSICSLAADLSDEVTVDMTTQRIAAHEKNMWMLNSMLAK